MKRKNLIIGFSILVFSMMLYFSFMEKNKIDYKINTPDKSEKQTKTNKLINNEYNYKKTEILEVNTKIDKIQVPQKTIQVLSKKRPITFKEVMMTPGIINGLKELSPETPFLWDYLLGLLDRLDQCTKAKVKGKGELKIQMIFNIDHESFLGKGVNFSVDNTNFTDEEAKIIEQCGQDVFIDTVMDLKNISPEPSTEDEFVYSLTIDFPIDENFVYKFIEADGSPN